MIERNGRIYFTLNEVAELIGVDKSTISRRLSRENLEVLKDGKRMYIPYETAIKLGATKEQLDEFIQKEKANVEQSQDNDNETDELLKELFGDLDVKEFNNLGSSPPSEKKEGGGVVDISLPSSSGSKSKKSSSSTSTKEKKADVPADAVKPVAKILGESYAKTLIPTLESLEWWNTAKELIAWHSIMIALQVAKVDPQEIIKKAEEFHDPVKFANYIKELLSAMVEAIDDASVIQQYREELEETQRQLEACLIILDKQAERIKELEADLSFALQRLSKKDLLEFYVWKGFIQPSVLFGGKVGVGYGGGGGSNEEIS